MEDDPEARFEAERAQEIARLSNQLGPLLGELKALRAARPPGFEKRDSEIEKLVGSILREIRDLRGKKFQREP
jgi:hypothetical protein